MRRFKLWILIGGIALGYYGFKEWRLSGVTKKTMQTLTCKALVADGYGDNAHVRLSDFMLSPGGFVYEGSDSKWKKVWIPVVGMNSDYAKMVHELPEDAELPSPKNFGVILQSTHVSNDSALGRIAQQDYLVGVVINEIDSLDSGTRRLLEKSYPGIDLEKCWILEHRRKVSGAGFGMTLMGVALALVALAAFLFFAKPKAVREPGPGPREKLRAQPDADESVD